MKKFSLLFSVPVLVAMTLLLSVVSPLNGATIIENESAPIMVATAPYFPIRSGNFWTYRLDGICCTTTTVLAGTTNIHGVETKALQNSTDGYIQYFTNDSNGIRLHGEFDPELGITLVFNPPVVIASASMSTGETVNSIGIAETDSGNFAYETSFTLENFTNITVPLRSFSVLSLQATVTLVGVGTVSSTTYLAKNVGIVKEVENDGVSTTTVELTATNMNGVVDFDGDGKADIGIYRNGTWSIIRTLDGGTTTVGWGGPTWEPVPADYDGDGKVDIAVRNANGVWSILRSSDGGNSLIGWSAAANDIPYPADYDGDGKADLVVYNNASAGWSIIRSSDGGLTYRAWGGPVWVPVAADYDGDGKVDIAVRNPNGLWSILRSSDGGNTLFGWSAAANDVPVPADYDGDGKADFAVYNNASSGWSIIRSSDGGLTYRAWGGPAWEPVAADYDGDGKADIAVYNASNGLWSIVRSSDGGNTLVGLGGGPQDIPLSAQ